MARSLSHLTGHELAALAAPFETPRRGMFRRNPKAADLSADDLPSRFMQKLNEVDTAVEAWDIIRKVSTAAPEVYHYENGHYQAFSDGVLLLVLGFPITKQYLEDLLDINYSSMGGSVSAKQAQVEAAARNHLDALQHQAEERGVFFHSTTGHPYIRKPDGKTKFISRAEAIRILR